MMAKSQSYSYVNHYIITMFRSNQSEYVTFIVRMLTQPNRYVMRDTALFCHENYFALVPDSLNEYSRKITPLIFPCQNPPISQHSNHSVMKSTQMVINLICGAISHSDRTFRLSVLLIMQWKQSLMFQLDLLAFFRLFLE